MVIATTAAAETFLAFVAKPQTSDGAFVDAGYTT